MGFGVLGRWADILGVVLEPFQKSVGVLDDVAVLPELSRQVHREFEGPLRGLDPQHWGLCHPAELPHLDVLAHTGRSLLVARALTGSGWRAVFGGAGKYAELIRQAGLDCRALPEMPASELVTESRRGKRWPFHSAGQIRPFVEAELALVRETKPDVIVFDHRYTAGISAEIAAVRRVSITNLWWTRYDATGMGLAETHPLFAACPTLRFIRRFGWADGLGNALARKMFRRWAKPYNTVRAEHGSDSRRRRVPRSRRGFHRRRST